MVTGLKKNEILEAIDDFAKEIYNDAMKAKPIVYVYTPTEIKWLRELGWLIEDDKRN
jgi:hypothetical protein